MEYRPQFIKFLKLLVLPSDFSITDFLIVKGQMHVSEVSTVMRSPEEVSIIPDAKMKAHLLMKKEETIETIKASPLKTRVSLKGKIVKVIIN